MLKISLQPIIISLCVLTWLILTPQLCLADANHPGLVSCPETELSDLKVLTELIPRFENLTLDEIKKLLYAQNYMLDPAQNVQENSNNPAIFFTKDSQCQKISLGFSDQADEIAEFSIKITPLLEANSPLCLNYDSQLRETWDKYSKVPLNKYYLNNFNDGIAGCHAIKIYLLSENFIQKLIQGYGDIIDAVNAGVDSSETLEAELQAIGYQKESQATDVFGLTAITASPEPNQSQDRITVFYFNGKIAEYFLTLPTYKYQYAVDINGQSLVARAKAALQPKTKPDATLKAEYSTVELHQEFKTVLDNYYETVEAGYKELKPITIPTELRRSYAYFVSDLSNVILGEICGFAGSPTKTKTTMDTILKANRPDIIENIIYGFNPAGRVHAAMILTRLGRADSPEIQNAITKLTTLNIQMSSCGGCIFDTIQTPEQVKLYITDNPPWPFD